MQFFFQQISICINTNKYKSVLLSLLILLFIYFHQGLTFLWDVYLLNSKISQIGVQHQSAF